MAIWDKFKDGVSSSARLMHRELTAEEQRRSNDWENALQSGALPDFVLQRMTQMAQGHLPWTSTATAAELLALRSHGVQPLGIVSGNCWYHFGYSWTDGHYEGWHKALERLRKEAIALGANAVVDVRLKTRLGERDDMDYAVIGTAVRIRGLAPSAKPVVATVSALEFVRLLENDVVPEGIAIGAHFDTYNLFGTTFPQLVGTNPFYNSEMPDLSAFLDNVRRRAIYGLQQDGARMGASVLAHTHFSQLQRIGEDDNIRSFLCRYIIIGSAVSFTRATRPAHELVPLASLADRPIRPPRITPGRKDIL